MKAVSPRRSEQPALIGEFRINTSDGRTLRAQLDDDDTARWERRLADPTFQSQIRGVSIHRDGVSHVLPSPTGFRDVRWYITRVAGPDGRSVALRARVNADTIQITLIVYTGDHRVSRVSVQRIGKVRYDPSREARTR